MSSEELRTKGTGEEENHNKDKKERTKVQEEFTDRKGVDLNYTSWQINRKPMNGDLESPTCDDDTSEDQDENTNQHDGHSYFEKFSTIKFSIGNHEDVSSVNNYNDKVMTMIDSIQKLEEKFTEKTYLLEVEKNERLKLQNKMCHEIGKTDQYFDKKGLFFLNFCRSDDSFGDYTENDEKQITNVGEYQNNHQIVEFSRKNFLRKNIELASTAMSKLPLTNEEKQQLDRILSDIDATDIKQEEQTDVSAIVIQNEIVNEEVDLNNEDLQNAFHFSETDKRRISEIDFELNTFNETQNLKLSSKEWKGNFWRNLLLEQMLKEIDEKLAVLRQDQDHTGEFLTETN